MGLLQFPGVADRSDEIVDENPAFVSVPVDRHAARDHLGDHLSMHVETFGRAGRSDSNRVKCIAALAHGARLSELMLRDCRAAHAAPAGDDLRYVDSTIKPVL